MSVLSRQRNHDQLDEIISSWTTGLDKYDLMHQLQGAGIAAGPVLTGKDVHFDPHYQSRNFLERVTYPEDRNMGARLFMGRPYKFSKTPLKIRGPAPSYGQDNEGLLKDLLGVDDTSYQALVQDVVVAAVPTAGEPVHRIPRDQMVEMGLLSEYDPDYRDRLGLS